MIAPTIEEEIKFYNERWKNQVKLNQLHYVRCKTILSELDILAINKPKILDFGCGTGWLTPYLRRYGPTTGIELSPTAVEEAKRKYLDVEFICGDIFRTQLPEGFYDVIISQEVIEHIENQDKYIQLAHNYLKPGGYIILTTPNKYVQKRRKTSELESWGLQPVENWLSVSDIKELMKRHYKIIRLKTIVTGFGSKGILRVANSYKLNQFVRMIRMHEHYKRIKLKLKWGLHIVIVAKKLTQNSNYTDL